MKIEGIFKRNPRLQHSRTPFLNFYVSLSTRRFFLARLRRSAVLKMRKRERQRRVSMKNVHPFAFILFILSSLTPSLREYIFFLFSRKDANAGRIIDLAALITNQCGDAFNFHFKTFPFKCLRYFLLL
jgi:hypothetical protein